MNAPSVSAPTGDSTRAWNRTGEPIRAVLFDFDGTLVFHTPDSVDVIRAACAERNHRIDAQTERRLRRTRHQYFVDPLIREELVGLSIPEFWRHFNRRLLQVCGFEDDVERFAAHVDELFAQTTFTYDCPPNGGQTLAALRERGYPLGLITNRENVPRFHELLDQADLHPFFDVTVASGEVGVRKPEPGIFHAALVRMGVTPDACLYVGDNYWADVVGAERAGIAPALLDPHRIFPEAQCLILDCLDDLLAWLPGPGV